jgi:SOS-response transcriptional repressor LexA
MTERFTKKQGEYLAFIESYTIMHGRAPAEADLERFFRTSPPTIHQMILKLEERGLISRTPGQPRSIKLLIDGAEIPKLKRPR